LNIESQIWDLFFERPLGEFDGRTLGALFGFSDIEKLWDRQAFNEAAAAASEACRRRPSHKFDDFLADLCQCLGVAVPPADVRNPSANYALAQLRWFSNWLEYRVASFHQCFIPIGAPYRWFPLIIPDFD
jgi:hypothetical protein